MYFYKNLLPLSGQEPRRLPCNMSYYYITVLYYSFDDFLWRRHFALQGVLADYNMLVDKLNTDTERTEVEMECAEVRATNEQTSQVSFKPFCGANF